MTKILKRVIVPSDRSFKSRENKLKVIQDSDGSVFISIDTYNHETGRYESSGVVEIRSGHAGGKKQALLVPLTRFVDQALELKQVSPMSRIEGWGMK